MPYGNHLLSLLRDGDWTLLSDEQTRRPHRHSVFLSVPTLLLVPAEGIWQSPGDIVEEVLCSLVT